MQSVPRQLRHNTSASRNLCYYVDHTTARWFFVCDECGLKKVSVEPMNGALDALKQGGVAHAHATQLMAMLSGTCAGYTLPISISGSPFQQRVWQEIRAIPHGQTISYTELAARAGNAKAVRAAASACGANPVPVAIPCHRVLRADGTLGGFAFGLPLKQRMLAFEASSARIAA